MNKLKSRARINEIGELLNFLKKALQALGITQGNPLFVILGKLIEFESEYQPAIGMVKTKVEKEEYDTKRDNSFRSIIYLLRGYLYCSNAEYRGAAQRLYAHFYKYKLSLIRDAYGEATSKINSILSSVDTSELQSDINLLPSIADELNNLKALQDSFADYIQEIGDVSEFEDSALSATELRDKAFSLIDATLSLIEGMSTVEPETYMSLRNKIENEINAINTRIDARAKKVEETGG